MPFTIALLHHPAGAYAFLVAAIVGSLYAARKAAFVTVFAAVAAGLLALLGFVAVPPSYAALALLGIGVALLHLEFLLPTSGAAGLLGVAVTTAASWLLLAPHVMTAQRLGVATVGTLVIVAAVAHTMRLRTLPDN